LNNLREFYCSNNQIRKIKNLPNNLQIFDCSNNHINEIKNIPNNLREFNCGCNRMTEIKNLPIGLRVFDCCNNQITKIENLPESLREFHCFWSLITNSMEIKKWEYICQKNKERDEYINEHLSIPNVGIELGGFQSSLLIPPIDDIIGSLLYL